MKTSRQFISGQGVKHLPRSQASRVIETLFKVYDKEGNLVDFILNEIQDRIDREIWAPIESARRLGMEAPPELSAKLRGSILKYRQGGVSTLILAYFLVEGMSGYACCVMLTHDKEHSEKLLFRARVMLKNMKGPNPKTTKLNDNEIIFEKYNSLFYIGTAGSKEFGRSATITHLHCSEIAFWKDPARLMKSLFQAVPKTGVILHETTANGWGNWLQKSWYNYLSGKGGFLPYFYPWFIHDDYYSQTPFTGADQIDHPEWLEELRLYKMIRLARPDLSRQDILQKLQWRREKIDENEGDQDRSSAIADFDQEYPSTYQIAFRSTGGGLFDMLKRHDEPNWKADSANAYILKGHPITGYSYSLGADFSGGTGNDDSAIVVTCLETGEQVYRWNNKYKNPVDFAEFICEVGFRFNQAYLVPEYNNHGIAGIAIIKRHYPLIRIFKHIRPRGPSDANSNIPSYGYGWKTTAMSKPYMIGVGQQFVIAGWKVHDPLTEDQLRSFAEDPDTCRIESVGDHDDCGMAQLLAWIGILKLKRISGLHGADVNPDIVSKAAEALVVETPKNTEHTHRDDDGHYLVNFSDMFASKKRSPHA